MTTELATARYGNPGTAELPMAFTRWEFIRGALYTYVIFMVATVIASLWALYFGVIYSIMFAGPIALVSTVLVGAPLSLLGGMLLRRTQRTATHLIVHAAAGTVAGALGLVVYLSVSTGIVTPTALHAPDFTAIDEFWWILVYPALTPFCAMWGWRITSRKALSAAPIRPFAWISGSAASCRRTGRRRRIQRVQRRELLGGEHDRVRADVLLETLDALRARDRGDVLALGEQPRERDLRGRRADLRRRRPPRPRRWRGSRRGSRTAGCCGGSRRRRAGRPSGSRRSGTRVRAASTARTRCRARAAAAGARASGSRDHSEYSVCSAVTGCTACARRMVVRRRLGEPVVPDLALGDELGERADGLLDRRARVHAVLVVEVDVVGAEPRERALDREADVLGAAVEAARCRRRGAGSCRTWWRRRPRRGRPPSARPSSSSLMYGP